MPAATSPTTAGAPAAVGATELQRLAAPLLVLVRSQVRLQLAYFAAAAPDGDPRALTLGACASAAGGGLLGVAWHLLSLQPGGVVLSLALVGFTGLALTADFSWVVRVAARVLRRDWRHHAPLLACA